MLHQMQCHHRPERAGLEAVDLGGVHLVDFGLRGVVAALFDAVIDQVDAHTVEVILEQTQQMTQPAAQFQQATVTRWRVASHQRRVIAPGEPVHAEASQAAVGVVPAAEIIAGIMLARIVGHWLVHLFSLKNMRIFRGSRGSLTP
jgi:hypothetical protein